MQEIEAFRRQQGLNGDEDAAPTPEFDEDIDLRAEDDALIAAELEAQAAEEAAKAAEEAAKAAEEPEEDEEDEDAAPRPAARRRGRRGGRTRRKGPLTLEGTFDHGEEGYGLWLDPAVQDDAIYAEHWAGHRPVEVTVEEDQIVIRRAGGDADSDDDEE